jgi:hypothetical protein
MLRILHNYLRITVNNSRRLDQCHAIQHYFNAINFGGKCVQSLYDDTDGGRIGPKHVVMYVTSEQKA